MGFTSDVWTALLSDEAIEVEEAIERYLVPSIAFHGHRGQRLDVEINTADLTGRPPITILPSSRCNRIY